MAAELQNDERGCHPRSLPLQSPKSNKATHMEKTATIAVSAIPRVVDSDQQARRRKQ